MSKLNTAFNGASAYYNRRAAHAGEAANVATRRRELRERGLIDHHSTNAEIAAVEHRLALQIRARDALAQTGARRKPEARLVGLTVLVAVLAAAVARGAHASGGTAAVVFVLAALLVLAVGVPVMRAQEDRRAAIVARADWNSRGVCRWCKSSAEHVVEGEVVHPLVAHAVEVDAEIRRG